MTRLRRRALSLILAFTVLLCALPAGAAEGETGELTIDVVLTGIDYLSELPENYGVTLYCGDTAVSFDIGDLEEGAGITAGKIVTGLEPGEYEITVAPEDHYGLALKGYNIKSKIDRPAVTVTAGGRAAVTVTKTFSKIAKKESEKGSFCIQAVAADDSADAVEGAKFELYWFGKDDAETFSGGNGQYTLAGNGDSVLKTDADGRMLLQGLEEREYRLQKSGLGTGLELPDFYYVVTFRSGQVEAVPSANDPDWYDKLVQRTEAVVTVTETGDEPDRRDGAYLFPYERPTGKLTLRAAAEGLPQAALSGTVTLDVLEDGRAVGSVEYTGAELLAGTAKTVREKESAGEHTYTVEAAGALSAGGVPYLPESLDYDGTVTVTAKKTAVLYAFPRFAPASGALAVEVELRGLEPGAAPAGLAFQLYRLDGEAGAWEPCGAAVPFRDFREGRCLFSGLIPGTYRVEEAVPVAVPEGYLRGEPAYGAPVRVENGTAAAFSVTERYAPGRITVVGRLTGEASAAELPAGFRLAVLLRDDGAVPQTYRAELTGAALAAGGGTARAEIAAPAGVSCAYAGWEAFLGEEPLPDGTFASGGRLYRIAVDGGPGRVAPGGELPVEVGVTAHTAEFRLAAVTGAGAPLPGVGYTLSREGGPLYFAPDGGSGRYVYGGAEPGTGLAAGLTPDGETGELAVRGLPWLGDYALTPAPPQGFEARGPIALRVDRGESGLAATLTGEGVEPAAETGGWRLTVRGATTALTGEVVLLGGGRERPALLLKADGAAVAGPDGGPRQPDEWTRSGDGWTFTYAGLPVRAGGAEIAYTVEPEPPGEGAAALQAGEPGCRLEAGADCGWAVAFDGAVGVVWTREALSPAREGQLLAEFTRRTGGFDGLLDAPILCLHGEGAAFGAGRHAISFRGEGVTGGDAWTMLASGALEREPLAGPVLTCRSPAQFGGVLEVVRRVEGLSPGALTGGPLDLLCGDIAVPFAPADFADGAAAAYLPVDPEAALSVAAAGGQVPGLDRTTVFSTNVASPDGGETFRLAAGAERRPLRLEVTDRFAPAAGGGFALRAADGSCRGEAAALEGVSFRLADSGGAALRFALRFALREGVYCADGAGGTMDLRTGPDGLVRVAGLADGSYTLTAAAPRRYVAGGDAYAVTVTGEEVRTAGRDDSGRWTVRTVHRAETALGGPFAEGADGLSQVLFYKPVGFYVNLDGAVLVGERARFTDALSTLTAGGLSGIAADLDSDGAVRALFGGEAELRQGAFPTDAEVLEQLAGLLRSGPGRSARTAEGRPVDPDLLEAGRYRVAWYALAEGADLWRVEGVLTGGGEPSPPPTPTPSPTPTAPPPDREESSRDEREPASTPKPAPVPEAPARRSNAVERIRGLFAGGDDGPSIPGVASGAAKPWSPVLAATPQGAGAARAGQAILAARMGPLRDILALTRDGSGEALPPQALLERLSKLFTRRGS